MTLTLIPPRCPHCHERLPPGLSVADHRDRDRWLCPKADNGYAYEEAVLADATEAVAAERRCPTCDGTVLPPTRGGVPRGSCHCPANLQPRRTP